MMQIKRKIVGFLVMPLVFITSCFADEALPPDYIEHNVADVSFDVSMPIDATGYILKGKNLTGGLIKFSNTGSYITPLLAHEKGAFQLPIVTNEKNKALIKTNLRYDVIKFINPNGIDNFFIKVGMGRRTQSVYGLDPTILKNGKYTWPAPIFSVGRESDLVNNKSTNWQFMQVGSVHGGPASSNVMYTQDFYLYTKGKGNKAIAGQPIKSARTDEILPKGFTTDFSCKVDGLWGAGGSDPYRTITGKCGGKAITYPAGPNLDYEYGEFSLPTIETPWTGLPSDSCFRPGEKKAHLGCVTAKLSLSFNYMAQKIRVPINKNITIFAESGTAYRRITPDNLRYLCKTNVYLKGILPESDCKKTNYLAGGGSYTFFSVGYEFRDNDGTLYTARYINIPGQENGNRLVWIDASNTYIYAISASNEGEDKNTIAHLQKALKLIKEKDPIVYDVLGKNFFNPILKKYTTP